MTSPFFVTIKQSNAISVVSPGACVCLCVSCLCSSTHPCVYTLDGIDLMRITVPECKRSSRPPYCTHVVIHSYQQQPFSSSQLRLWNIHGMCEADIESMNHEVCVVVSEGYGNCAAAAAQAFFTNN